MFLSRVVFANDELEALIKRNRSKRCQVVQTNSHSGIKRDAAAISIQSVFRGWNTRRKYLIVKYPNLSNLTTNLTSSNGRAKNPVTLKELQVQEKLIQKYKEYTLIYDKVYKNEELVEFPQFAAVFIQAWWRCWKARGAFEKYLGLKFQERWSREVKLKVL